MESSHGSGSSSSRRILSLVSIFVQLVSQFTGNQFARLRVPHPRDTSIRVPRVVPVFKFNFSRGRGKAYWKRSVLQLPTARRHVVFPSFSRREPFTFFSLLSLSSLKIYRRERMRARRRSECEKTTRFALDRGRHAASIDVTRNCASNENGPWLSTLVRYSGFREWATHGVSLSASVNREAVAQGLATGHACISRGSGLFTLLISEKKVTEHGLERNISIVRYKFSNRHNVVASLQIYSL